MIDREVIDKGSKENIRILRQIFFFLLLLQSWNKCVKNLDNFKNNYKIRRSYPLNLGYLFNFCSFPSKQTVFAINIPIQHSVIYKICCQRCGKVHRNYFYVILRKLHFSCSLAAGARKITTLWKQYPRESTVGFLGHLVKRII